MSLEPATARFLAPIAEVFPAAGVVDLLPALESPEFKMHLAAYDQWIENGNHGAMEYLKRGRDRRADPRLLFPATQSVLCVLEPYVKSPYGEVSATTGPRYARYLRGPDYHERIVEKLEQAMVRIRDGGYPGLTWKVCVDTSAVLERAWAHLCGLGWIGKNSLLIHPQLGSYVFIGVVFLSHTFSQGPKILPDYCGRCDRCLTACPTQAITSHKTVLSKQCIAYWTLEKRGELEFVDSAQQAKLGNWVAGCDICQEVCPFNTKPVRQEQVAGEMPPLRTYLEHLLESETDYRARVKSSALSRVKPTQFKRNLLLALENSIVVSGGVWMLEDSPRDLWKALEVTDLPAELNQLVQQCRDLIAPFL